MMDKYKIKKIFLLLTISIIASAINVKSISATAIIDCVPASWANGDTSTGYAPGSGSTRPANPSGPGGGADCGGGLTAVCWSTASMDIWSTVYVDMYDMYGNEICDPLNANRCLENPILAGTYIGLDVYEKKGYTYTIRTGAIGIQEYHSCTKIVYYDCSYTDEDGNSVSRTCSYSYHINVKGTTCPADYSDTGVFWRWDTACTAAFQKCKDRVKPSGSMMSLEPSYEVSYKDSNDIDETNSDGKFKTSTTVTGNIREEIYNLSDGSWYWSLTEEKTFEYNRQKTCINVKTSKVRYVNYSDSCNSEDEYTINTKDGYWKYFIPLNTNSAEGFSFTMHSSGGLADPAICRNIIDKYDHFASLIKPFAGTFNKIQDGDSSAVIKSKKADAKRLVRSGCYYETTVDIPITQLFYNEINSGQNFKGFNFYYRPIDINDPFPNGLTSTSLWYEWNEEPNQDPDITESYDEITYIANTSGNEDIIREYTDTHPYTNWYNMYVNGISSFIEKEGIVTRGKDFDRESIYALGCGPKNTNVTNVFQQEECDD